MECPCGCLQPATSGHRHHTYCYLGHATSATSVTQQHSRPSYTGIRNGGTLPSDDFVHLHVHDEYSMLDGAASTPNLVQRAAELGQPAVAQTNHGNLHGTYIFHKECKANGIKPIIGMEAYCAPTSRTNRGKETWGTNDEGRELPSGGSAYTHLTLLAKNRVGLSNLYKLSSLSYSEGFYQKPRIDLPLLASLREGIIVGSGCLSGELQARLQLGQDEKADQYVRYMKEMFGDAFFIEVMDHHFERETKLIPALTGLGSKYGVRLVATNDSHYISATDSLLHDAMLCLGTQKRIDDPNRMRFDGHGYYLKSRAEMELLSLDRRSLTNALVIAETVEDYGDMFAKTLRMPTSFSDDPEGDLTSLINQEMRDRNLPREYVERSADELNIICPAGFADYFLIMSDAVQFAKSVGIPVGVGRGSAAGSLVAYLLGITGVDPLKHDLLFERFLNPERVSLPDIDTDFSQLRRDEVFDYVVSKYGQERCARIFAPNTIGSRSSLNDASRVLGRAFGTGARLAQALPRTEFGRMPTLSEADMSKVDDTEVWDLATRLEGLTRSTGLHAGGFVISPDTISDIIPTYVPERKSEAVATQWDMHAVEALGFVKFDFLGLKTLDVIDDALRMSDARLPTNLDDPKTYELLRSGDTLGCFQLDGQSMRALLKRLAPRNFEDLAAVIALYRPGPMGAGAHNQYADRRNGREAVTYPHPEFAEPLRSVLASTYGVIVYQEQVMRILQRVCGYSLAQADLVRKAMGKKDRALLASESTRYYEGGTRNGFSRASLTALWEILIPFADYSFGKGHATAYGYNAYYTAYLKAHFPWEFMASLLTHASTASKDGKPSQAEEYVTEVARMGIPVLPPSVNGGATWTPGERGIHYGITSIKGVGDKVAGPLLRAAPFRSWDDFLTRAPKSSLNLGTVKALVSSGALDVLGPREALSAVSERHIAQALSRREELKKGERGFGRSSYELPEMSIDWTLRGRQEVAALGVRLSYPAVTLVCSSATMDESAWTHLRRTLESARGGSRARVVYGTWVMETGLWIDTERVRRLVEPLGIEVT